MRVGSALVWFHATTVLLTAFPSAVSAEDSAETAVAVQYQDNFSYASGGKQIQIDGQDPVTEGEIHCSMYTYGRPHRRAAGELKLVMTEENNVFGPDGRAGVLRLEFAEIPAATDFAGFVIDGNAQSGKITISGWTPGEVTVSDLDRTFVSIRFRGENLRESEKSGIPLSFRLEPEQEESFPFAADFGTLVPTRNWRTLKRPIGSAKNLEAFLTNVNLRKTQEFRLVWSQIGPINLYQPGDSLLIDDVSITIE